MEAVEGHLKKAWVVVEGLDLIRKAKEVEEARRKRAKGEEADRWTKVHLELVFDSLAVEVVAEQLADFVDSAGEVVEEGLGQVALARLGFWEGGAEEPRPREVLNAHGKRPVAAVVGKT